MKSRIVVLGLVLVAGLLHPARLEADKFKGIDPLHAGILVEDSTCPSATHVLVSFCDRIPYHSLVFNAAVDGRQEDRFRARGAAPLPLRPSG